MVSVGLVEFDFRGVRLAVSLDLGADELARLAEHHVVDADMVVLVPAAVAALRRLACRWLEDLEYAVVALGILQLLLDVHLLACGLLLVGADTGSLVGRHL